MNMQVVAHTSFLGPTGYNSHSQNFFVNLNNYIPTRIRNYSYTPKFSKFEKDNLHLLIESKWNDPPYKIGKPFKPNPKDSLINIVLNESHHYYFYDKYQSPKIAYNVWEATKQIPEFFNRILEYDQFWCPTEWQRQCTIEQGYPEDRVKVVPEAVDIDLFKPDLYRTTTKEFLYEKYNIPDDVFTFIVFGRWDYRKSITEIIQAFNQEFKNDDKVMLILSVDNPFATDNLKTTEKRLKFHKLESDKIKVLHFVPREDYIKWLQCGNVFLSCARSEGWNLPLSEAIACGTPSIYSGWGAQMEFAKDIAHPVNVPTFKAPESVFMLGDKFDYGMWGEPDFDHLKSVMRKVYNDYDFNKKLALAAANPFRKKYNWDNAAKLGAKYITELAESKLISIPTYTLTFKTIFELTDNDHPKITFIPSKDVSDKLTVVIKDYNKNIIFTAPFENIKKDLGYWLSCNKSIDKIIFEIIDSKNICLHSESKEYKLNKNIPSMELYQDQYVNGSVIEKGVRSCALRYESIKTVFDQYTRPFTILDIGANFGYYSIRAATSYDAVSVMIEGKDNEVNTLTDLCNKNNCSDKLIVLKNTMNLYKLKELSKCEHFDVVLALNVIHHFKREEIEEICQVFTELGDNLILETPPLNDEGACGQENLQTITKYFQGKKGTKLGKFKRHTSDTESTIMWFKNKKTELKWPYYEYEKLFIRADLDVNRLKERGSNHIDSNYNDKTIQSPRRKEITKWIPGINLKTFIKLNGVFPKITDIIKKIITKDIIGDYKWDNTNNDLVTHNLILNGHKIHIIDYNDEFIEKTSLTDDEQLNQIIFELSLYYDFLLDTPDAIKLNLGCGNDIKPGYVNIDKYNNTGKVDSNADIGDLPYEDNTVSEIYTSHVFEHIPLNEVYSVLTEWKRVLKIGGRLVLRLPDLETEVNIWLNASDEKKWTEVHRIFGAQSHPGNTHYIGFNPGSLKSFLEIFNFNVKECKIGNRGFGDEIQCTAINLLDEKIVEAKYICHFVDGPFVDIQGDSKDKGYYQIDFLDPDNDSTVHQGVLRVNQWTRPFRKYFTNWKVQIKRNGILKFEHKFDLKNKNVLIGFDSKSLGDTIAWIPYIEVFRQKHNCNVILSTFWNKLFEGSEAYKNIKFIKPGSRVENLYASYSIGTYDDDMNKNVVNWRLTPLQRVCSDILGLEYKEIVPDIFIKPNKRLIQEKYVTLSEWSTFQCKHWNYEGGWQTVIDFLNDHGWKTMVVSKEKTNLKNIINRTDRSIENAMTNIYHSDLFMGVSSGPSWLAWALKVPVVMVSGFSKEWAEFSTGVERIINKESCNGCFNNLDNKFDRGNWNWCPHHEGSSRQFECTKTITPNQVIDSIKKILKIT